MIGRLVLCWKTSELAKWIFVPRLFSHVPGAVCPKEGHRLEEIGRALKTDTAILKKPIAMLLAEKKLKTTGAKRGTKYFVR